MPTLIAQPNEVNFSLDPMYVTIESDKFIGASAPYDPTHENLSCYIEVWKDNNPGTDELICKLHAPYSRTSKRVSFDISGLIELKEALPVLKDDVGDTELWKKCDSVFGFIYVKFNDQWGTPVVPDTLLVTVDRFCTILGSARQSVGEFSNTGFSLHSLKNALGQFISKEVTTEQPDWLYFYLAGGKVTHNVSVRTITYYTDGTNSTDTQMYSMTGNSVNYVSSGYKLRIEPYITAGKTVKYYDVIVENEEIEVFAQQRYILDQCTVNDIYLAYFNGLGGIESVRMKGKYTSGYEASRKSYKKTRWGSISRDEGSYGTFNQSGRKSYEFNSGFYDKDYIDHLQNLLLGRVWMIDTYRNQLQALTVESTSMEDVDVSGETLYYIKLNCMDSQDDMYYNTLHL